MKQRAPALPDSTTFQQLWDALGSKLIETAQGHLLYTQGVRGSSPLPPTIYELSYFQVVGAPRLRSIIQMTSPALVFMPQLK